MNLIFPSTLASRPVTSCGEKVGNINTRNRDYFIISGSAKKPDEKKSKEDEQTLADLSLTYHQMFASKMSASTKQLH